MQPNKITNFTFAISVYPPSSVVAVVGAIVGCAVVGAWVGCAVVGTWVGWAVVGAWVGGAVVGAWVGGAVVGASVGPRKRNAREYPNFISAIRPHHGILQSTPSHHWRRFHIPFAPHNLRREYSDCGSSPG